MEIRWRLVQQDSFRIPVDSKFRSCPNLAEKTEHFIGSYVYLRNLYEVNLRSYSASGSWITISSSKTRRSRNLIRNPPPQLRLRLSRSSFSHLRLQISVLHKGCPSSWKKWPTSQCVWFSSKDREFFPQSRKITTVKRLSAMVVVPTCSGIRTSSLSPLQNRRR